MPAVIQDPRWGDLLRRLFGVKDSLGLAMADDVLATAPLIDPAAQELLLPRGERLWTAFGSQAAVAAQFSFVRLENPDDGSGRLLLIKRVIPQTAPKANVRIATVKSTGVGVALGAGNHDARPLDGREVNDSTISGTDRRGGSRGAGLTAGILVTCPSPAAAADDGHVDIAFPATLPGGWAIDVECRTVNQQILANFIFGVKYLDPQERR